MKTGIGIIVLILLIQGCNYDSRGFFYHVKNDHYYNTEIFNNSYKEVYGEWILKAVSGELATQGYSPEFERIVIEKIGMFKVFRNDSLLGFGRINVIEEVAEQALKISFSPDRGLTTISFYGTDKFLSLRDNHLNLFASCCQQFNYHFERLK
jgi:hypothetical protein